MLRILILILLTFGFWKATYAQVADNPHADKAGRKAQQAAQSVKPGVSKEKDRLSSEMKLSPADMQKPAKPNRLSPSERVYIFVSSSMPMTALRRYASDLDRLADPNIVMVLRGFVGGMRYYKPTGDFIGQVLRKDEACEPGKVQCEAYQAGIQVDPMLFRRYGITQVPAVVYVPDVKLEDSGSDVVGGGGEDGDYFVVYGDASLRYVLGVIGRH